MRLSGPDRLLQSGRRLVTRCDIADALVLRIADTDAEIPTALHAFIEANATRAIDVQLALPLRIASGFASPP